MPKATTVYGIVSYGGHLVRGMVRVVLTTEEPISVLENDKLYYGEDVKARVTKTKTLTMHDLTEKLEEAFASHKTDVPHMYKLNSTESVKILKTVFDVKTCKKLSFSKDSDDDSEDNDSTISTKEEVKATGKSTKEVKATGKTTKAVDSTDKDTTTVESGKSTKEVKATGKTTKAVDSTGKGTKAVEPVGKTTTEVKATGKTTKAVDSIGKSAKTDETKVVKDEVSASKKKPDLTDSKKTSTSKVKSSTVRIPLSDSDDDELQSEDDLDA
jgi:hypothetical protein